MWLQATVVVVIKESWEMQWKLAQYVQYFVVIKLLYISSERDFSVFSRLQLENYLIKSNISCFTKEHKEDLFNNDGRIRSRSFK